ncbi:MAG: polysaccharide pyruvyl transferase family protein [Ancrocorticia sp.]|uniref:polysaccharide pyruvyl transferase family protein n=1 Tax=Ancrocorticia sp. TaxID=2593684 RepID=UPI003F92DB99
MTNRDSDNLGDQIIEASAISILHAVMDNLGYNKEDYSIKSRAAGMITRKYMETEDKSLLESAEKSISESDIIVFGGAPLFNYAYQVFYKRTIITLELAQKYGVPVLFSSIGVEPFDESNPKCRDLKTALNLPCVRQITTRDDYDAVLKYVEGTEISSAKVSDPAVLADIVFRKKPTAPRVEQSDKPAGYNLSPNVRALRKSLIHSGTRALMKTKRRAVHAMPSSIKSALKQTPLQAYAAKPKDTVDAKLEDPAKEANPKPVSSAPASEPQKCIGLVVTRRGIFKDNHINFSAEKQRQFWRDVISLLTEKGYTYKLFTTGHFSDEVFLDEFVRHNNIDQKHFKCPLNRPEDLINELKACDGVIAYRLHASITSYALGVPSIGLSWNFKIPYFYDSIGYSPRALEPHDWNAMTVVSAIENAMEEGVSRDEAFAMTVYESLFAGIKGVFRPESRVAPYSLTQLQTKLPRNTGTSYTLYRERINRKIRRTYENYAKELPPEAV